MGAVTSKVNTMHYVAVSVSHWLQVMNVSQNWGTARAARRVVVIHGIAAANTFNSKQGELRRFLHKRNSVALLALR